MVPGRVPPHLGSALIGLRPCRRWDSVSVGYHMFSISCARISYGRDCANTPSASAAAIRNVMRRLAIVVGAASLTACAQSSVLTDKSENLRPSRQASREHHRTISIATNRPVAVPKKHTPFASNHKAAATQVASQGVASFYTEGTQTASGEKFNTNELTAAHPTLPFGTRLRVTNVNSGQSVTVRVNDRGPYAHGRVVDVSHAAAEKLGMVGDGVAKVKLDVLQ
jgi:rare lipoprotein A